MGYIENPKTKGSGILCCIPQKGKCPNNCADCFYNSERGYLEPLNDNTPNMPSYQESLGRIIRVNDGNDSNNQRSAVINNTMSYARKFYNTSFAEDLAGYDAPIVLTVNPGGITDHDFHRVRIIPDNLMMVRVRVNMWNLELVDEAVLYYTGRNIPVILTFLAYFEQPIPKKHKNNYVWKKRTLNPYWCIKREPREKIVDKYALNKLVYPCGHRSFDTKCRYCGNCLKFYYATMEKLRRL